MSQPTDRIPELVQQLYRVVRELEALFPGRHFTPDGHLVGSIGEVLAAHIFDLVLEPASTRAFDARTRDGRTVEIKATQRAAIGLRGEDASADLLVVLRIGDDGTADVVYTGPAGPVWGAAGPIASNGQRRVSLKVLDGLGVAEADRLQ